MRTRRLLVVFVVLSLLAAACGGGGDPEGVQVGAGSSDGIRDAFATAGIDIIDDPAASVDVGLELWSYQVDNMAREIDDDTGFLGSQLDELVGSPGGMPFSYLIAGWLSAQPTPVAEAALELIGEQPWDQAPAIVYPSAVLTLFVADALQATGQLEGSATANAKLASFAQSGICSTLANWVSDALDFIFDAVKVEIDGDGGFLDWLGVVWNAAVDLIQGIIEGVIEVLAAPVIAAIASALGVIGTLSMVASLLQPWNLDLEPSNLVTRFALTGEPNVQENVLAKADPGYEFEWPGYLEDCASVAGLDLPNPSDAEGSDIAWKEIGFPEFGSTVFVQETIDANNEARAEWVTAREESDDGDELAGTVSIFATVELDQIDELKTMLTTLITGQLPTGPFTGLVEGVFAALTEPIFDKLAELVQIKGSTSVTVIYHDDDDEEETPPTSVIPNSASCVTGSWNVNGVDAAAIYVQGLGAAAQDPYFEGTVTAEFSENGEVRFEFRDWTIGNRTFTDSPLDDVLADLTGDTFTVANGTATGTWNVSGNRLQMVVADFDTQVTQRVISPELEIDSTIDALPDLARVYLIPTAAARFICDEFQLGIEWIEGGSGVRWFRNR